MITLAKLTENQTRLIIALFFLIISLFVIIGLIGIGIIKIMQTQGSKADEMLRNVVEAKYFKKERHLISFGVKKNIRLFFTQARIPMLILIIAWVGYLFYSLFTQSWINPLSRETGFMNLFPILGEWPKEKFFFIRLVNGFPEVLEPGKFEWSHLFSYLFVPANLVGIVWYFITVQAYAARSFRIRKIAHGIFRKKLVPDKEEPTQPVDVGNPTI